MTSLAKSPDRMTFAEDLLHGAAEISAFFYGDSSAENRSRIYRLIEQGKLPAFRMGGILCARQSTIINYIERQEQMIMSQSCCAEPPGKNENR